MSCMALPLLVPTECAGPRPEVRHARSKGVPVRIPSPHRLVLATALAASLATMTTGSAWAGTPTGATPIAATAAAPAVSRALPPNTRFYVDPGSSAARQAVTDLFHHDLTNAANMAKLATWPEAAWFTKGT